MTHPNSLLANLSVFHGKTSHTTAYVYARLDATSTRSEDGWQLSGIVDGPYCKGTRTLPSRLPLRDLGPGDSLLAAVVVPDPCIWSSLTPAIYKVKVELQRDGQTVEVAERELGIRAMGASDRNLLRNGKRFVVRGVHHREIQVSRLGNMARNRRDDDR